MALDKLKTLLLPKEEIVGIEITDNGLKCIGFSGTPNKNWIDFNVNLPAGVIVNGNLIKPDVLTAILNKTKKAYCPKKKEKVYAILSLNTNLFYTNVLSLPNISSPKELKEAIELNTSLVSPIKLEEAYFDFEDWTHPGEVNKKIFIVLAPKVKIDPYLKCFKESNFELLALEFGLLGLNRLVCSYANAQQNNFLLLNFRAEGINMAIGNSDGSLILPTSESWNDILKDLGVQNITVDTLKKYLGLEIPKLISFLASHYNQALEGFYILSNNNIFNQETSRFLIADFGLKPLALNLPNSLLKRSADEYIALGTALRGLIKRENDTIVSLMPVGTEQKYQETRNYNYVSFWAKAISITMLFILVVFMGVNFGLFKPTFKNISNNNLNIIISPDQQKEMSLLKKEADDFNRNLDLMITLAQKGYNWERVLAALGENQEAILQNVKMIDSGDNKSVTATFSAKNREIALGFREKIKTLPFVESIDMPAKLFTEQPDSQLVQFDLIVKVK